MEAGNEERLCALRSVALLLKNLEGYEMRWKKTVMCIGIMLAVLLSACSRESRWQRQYDLGMQYLMEGSYEEAIVAFNEAIRIDPNQASAYLGRGAAYVGSGETEENLAAALSDYQKAVELDGQNAEGYLGSAEAYVLQEEYAAALEILNVGLDNNEWDEEVKDRISEISFDLGTKFLTDGDYEKAIDAFSTAIECDPDNASAYLGRADAYISSGETEENLTAALADYQKAVELDEQNAEAYLGLADVYIRLGDYDAALEILQEGLEKTGGNEEIAGKIEEMEAGNITDSSGKIRRQSSRDASGTLIWYHELTYNPDGTQASVTSYDGSGNQTGHVDLAYDEEGKSLVSYQYSTERGEVGKVDSEYDASGNCVREEWYDETGSLMFYFLKDYDSSGNCIREERYSETGEQEWFYVNEYDEDGRIVRRNMYRSDGQLDAYYLYEYNTDGKRAEESHYDADGQLTMRVVERYDEEGNNIGYDTYDGEGNLEQSVMNEG